MLSLPPRVARRLDMATATLQSFPGLAAATYQALRIGVKGVPGPSGSDGRGVGGALLGGRTSAR